MDELLVALRRVYDTAEVFEDHATEEKHRAVNHNTPEGYYQQGRADAFRIILVTIHESHSKERLGL